MVSLLHYFYFSFIRSDSILRFAAEDYRAAIQPTERRVKEFAGNGRVLIRPSGTEPLVRVMIEGEDQKYITKKAKEIATLIESKLK